MVWRYLAAVYIIFSICKPVSTNGRTGEFKMPQSLASREFLSKYLPVVPAIVLPDEPPALQPGYPHGTVLHARKPKGKCWLKSAPRHCDSRAPYRTIDGSCNNIKNPNWGRSLQLLSRIMAPKYDHGDMRSLSVTGAPLPSPREITTTITRLATHADFDQRLTNMHMLWGQFIDHDISHTPMVPKVMCCDKQQHLRSPDCIPIPIPTDDPFWGPHGRTCMELRRSIAVKNGECGESFREQINNLTSFIDAGAVYGDTNDRARQLRSFHKGQMRTSGDDLLPIDKPTATCNIPSSHSDKRCFAAGDKRSNVWPALTAIHTLWLREHNHIAHVFYNKLKLLNPLMSESQLDEKVYQETRRIIGALLQVINYSEYLPNVLGRSMMKKHRLNIGQPGVYKPTTNPTVSNVFGTAAFRFGHSEIPFGTQPKTANFQNYSKFVTFEETFNQPRAYKHIGQSNTMRGVTVEPALKFDDSFAQDIRDKLFARTFDGVGLDLPAVSTQRAREHGIPSYNHWRAFCGLPKITSFSRMPDHSFYIQAKFAQVYAHPDDIDLFIGGVTENLVDYDAHVGPTFACLLAEQFKRLKEGDRFWFENQGTYANSFSTKQIEQLRKVKLSKIICQNSDSDLVPVDVFRLNSPIVSCNDLPYLNLWNWF